MNFRPLVSNKLGNRPLVIGLFLSTCLLSIVSWYTTWQGMALYLTGWFAFIAAIGIQSSLVLVSWLAGQVRRGRVLLVGVYVMTAIVSIAFSYASLHTWFAAQERPAQVERRLYDILQASAGTAEQLLANAEAEQQKHVLALEALAATERSQGFASTSGDSDPYLARIREAVANEAHGQAVVSREAPGAGVRHAAFERHVRLARQELEQVQAARKSLSSFKMGLRPLASSEQQIRAYRDVYDSIPWKVAEASLHEPHFEKPVLPSLQEHLDVTASGQEDLLLAFQELFTAPTYRHILALLLAAFIDLIVFLVAASASPHLAGSIEMHWCAAAAVLDGTDPQLLARSILRKLEPDSRGLAKVESQALTPGERQLCLLLCAQQRAIYRESGQFVLDLEMMTALIESLVPQGLLLRTTPFAAEC